MCLLWLSIFSYLNCRLCFFKYSFIYFSLAVLGLPCCAQVFSSCSAQISNCGSFSCCRGQALGHMGPVLVAHRLICPMECWIFQDQESELVSPALAGKFLTPGAPGKPKFIFLVGTIYQAKQHSVPNEIRNCTLFPKKMKVIR